MATKNMARTVIEGGRAGYNKWQRRSSNARARACERNIEARLRRETDFDDLVIPERVHVRKDFRDKLGPTRRWLRSQLGRPWDLVRGELFARFDTRTTPGRHIVFCHMLPSVGEEGDVSCKYCRREFVVDARGILRTPPPRVASWERQEPIPAGLDPCGWLDGRRVGARGPVLFWFTPTPAGAYRQAGRLTHEECVYWRALPQWFRKQHVSTAPLPFKRN